MKILNLDIETFPNEAYVWGIWQQNVGLNQIKKPGSIASWAAMFVDGNEMYFDSVENNTYAGMIRGIYKLMNEADVIVGYNSKRFDIPWLQGAFVQLGLKPPKPFKQIDLMTVCRRQFKFPSYKLEYVVKALGIGEKMGNEGFPLWEKCMQGDKAAWAKMEEYNCHDVTLQMALYERILPYITNHPNRSLTEGLVCPNCGGSHYIKEGKASNKAGMYQQYSCKDCGAWFRGTENLAPKEKFVPL